MDKNRPERARETVSGEATVPEASDAETTAPKDGANWPLCIIGTRIHGSGSTATVSAASAPLQTSPDYVSLGL